MFEVNREGLIRDWDKATPGPFKESNDVAV